MCPQSPIGVPSQNLTRPLLVLTAAESRFLRLVLLPVYNLMTDNSVYCQLEDILHTTHLFAAAFHVYGVHPFRYGSSLLWSDGCQTLSFQEVNTCALGPEV